jgi:hypothetical protein
VATTTKRHRRIERRAIPAVLEAYRAGKISAKRADLLLYLPPTEQAAELERRLSDAREREAKHRRAAATLRGYLDGLNGQPPDLHQLNGIIRKALS